MISPSPEAFFTITDSEIDSSAIMTEIGRRITERRKTVGLPEAQFPTFEGTQLATIPDDLPSYDPNIYYNLKLISEHYPTMPTEMLITEHSPVPLPIPMKWRSWIRRQLHGLVLFYTNRLADHQTEMNRLTVTLLNLLTLENQRQQQELFQLRQEVAHLKQERQK